MTKWIGVVALGVGIVAAGLYWSSERDATPEGVAMDWSSV
ncbi:MAG: hypothetical protein ACI9AQ_001589, partial [Dinoroseobacter sp.]